MQRLPVFNPYTNELIQEVPLFTMEQAFEMLSSMSLAFSRREKNSEKFIRIERLIRLKELMVDAYDDLVRLAVQEGGKPITDTRIEVDRAVSLIDIAIAELRTEAGKVVPMGLTNSTAQRTAFTLLEPLGVVLGIAAFNHPLNMVAHLVIPALAVGSPIIVKPALKTPLVCIRMMELIHSAGFDKNDCQVLCCDNVVTAELARQSDFKQVTFIGAAEVGWKIRASLAPGTSCVLEHGGSAAAIIDQGFLMAEVVDDLIKSAFYHSGQVCVSMQRLFVHEDDYEYVEGLLIAKIKTLKVGDPSDATTQVGPMIDTMALERVEGLVNDATDQGARVVIGGVGKQLHYLPTLLVDVPEHAAVAQKEVFGPVLLLYRYRDLEDAIKSANSVNYCFQAAIFSKDIDKAMGAAKRLTGTAVLINDHTAFRADWMPFGGSGQSGLGLGGVPLAMKALQHEKLVVIKSREL